ncbi:trophoblast-specific protein alpha-like isoform X3 [Alexandromys fortis]|uniref:trophoblast-specific protein alpha-like n=1 Tax=Alexandromys fortis TaxID=100897 RepID=UPI002153367C|nr:trophoblast-specific protein alpha-like [Microtus fortis]XP_050000348.1 trophoblast-specific protein alpha-like isoform X3 [Microtus fortis]XP_050000349.1 trophoblast-specific protein alpha-like isoform X3 [Microtus fortis]
MNPAVFLVILCLAVASAAESPDGTLEVKDQEATITNEKTVGEEQSRVMWEEFMKKIEQGNKEDSLEVDNVNPHVNVFDGLIPEEFKKETNELVFRMFEDEEKTQTEPADDFEDWSGSGDAIPVRDQPQ